MKRALPWLIPAMLIALWQAAAMLGLLSAQVLPAPTEVAAAGWHLACSGTLWSNIEISAWRALIGFVIGGGIGFALGIVNGLSPVSETLTDSTLQMLRNIPHLALIPLVILWFGIGEEAKVFLIALGVFFPIYLNTYHGIRTVEPGLKEMGRVYGLGRWALFTQVIFPGALPSIMVGVRFALGSMWLTLIAAEALAAESGIGYMTTTAREFMQTDIVVVGTLLYALLGKSADVITKAMERRLLRWHPTYQRQ